MLDPKDHNPSLMKLLVEHMFLADETEYLDSELLEMILYITNFKNHDEDEVGILRHPFFCDFLLILFTV
jgi:hypothetical protein